MANRDLSEVIEWLKSALNPILEGELRLVTGGPMPLPLAPPGELFQNKARLIVVNYFNYHKEKTDDFELKFEDTYVVWFCKTLQNWKALVSTTVPDGMYYELTYNGDDRVTYIDAYKKHDNVAISDEEVTGSPRPMP